MVTLSEQQLAELLRMAKEAHTKHEADNGPDPDWVSWYAHFMYETALHFASEDPITVGHILPDVPCEDRRVMPQIDEKDYPALFDWLETQGVQTAKIILPWDAFTPRQKIEFDLVERPPEPGLMEKPILASVDLRILDGNHRWALHRRINKEITSYVVERPFLEAVDLLCSFPQVYTLGASPQPRRL